MESSIDRRFSTGPIVLQNFEIALLQPCDSVISFVGHDGGDDDSLGPGRVTLLRRLTVHGGVDRERNHQR